MLSAVRRAIPIMFPITFLLVGQAYGQFLTPARDATVALSADADVSVDFTSGADAQPPVSNNRRKPILPSPGLEGSLQPQASGESLPSPFEVETEAVISDPTNDLTFSTESLVEDDGWTVVDKDGPLLWKQVPLLNDTGTWFWRGRWYTRQEVVAMVKVTPKNRIYALDSSSSFNNQRLTPDSDPHGWEPGIRITFGNIIGRDKHNRDYAAEFTYMGLFEYTTFALLEARTPGNINTVLGGQFNGDGNPSAAFNGANNQSIQYDSDYNSFETNLVIRSRLAHDRVELQPNGKWIRHSNPGYIRAFRLGFRTVTVNEQFFYSSRGPNNGDLDIYTYNDMFGPQFGGELLDQKPDWAWGISVMVGGLYNFASRHIHLVTEIDDESNVDINNEADDQMNFFGELKVTGSYNVRPNVALFGAYQVMYLSGIATAENQAFLKPAFPEFDTRGDARYHGLSLGAEMVW